jgi:Ca2+-transporting ATPase
MITGDNELTAVAIAKKVKLIPENEAGIFKITGANLAKLSDKKLVQSIQKSKACVFSRVSPVQKLRIVKLMKAAGEIIAVTGDGVNDAPALRQAHIGVSMGKIGTSVAKEAAQIVLADDSYSTLIVAIKEGRTIYQNLIKTVKSCYTSNFGELSVVLLGIFFAGKLAGVEPLTPVQILLIDLLGELGPLIALTFDPLFKDSMNKPPRNTGRSVLNKIALTDIIGTGLFMGASAFIVFLITLTTTQDPGMASPSTYIMLILVQYINMLSRRHHEFIISDYLFTNKYLWWSMGITFAIILGLIYSPIGAMEAVSFKPLDWKIWLYIMGILTVVLAGLEIKKKLINKWTISEYGEL